MKNFLKSTKGKICAAAAGALVLAGAVFGGYQYWLYQQPKFHDLTVELGTTSIGIQQFMTEYAQLKKCSFVSDVSTLDIGKVGQTELTLRHGKQEETILFTVEDTTAPEVAFVTSLTKTSSYIPAAEDFVESVSDLSQTTVSFGSPVTVPDDYSDTQVTIVVEDASGNQTQGSCTLSIAWLAETFQLELGQELKVGDILLEPETDGDLLDQADIDAVNAGGVGEYTITSSAGGKTMTCTVTVADTQGPALELQDVAVYVGQAASLEDFVVSAADISGDVALRLLTEMDFDTLGQQTVTIEAADIYGNVTTGEAVLSVTTDMEPPVISGLSNLNVEKNSEPDYMTGVSARDEVDGACTVKYDASKVDTSKAGTYYVTYTAKDKSGNTASSRRKVVVAHDAEDTAALVKELAASLSNDPEKLRDYVRSNISYSHSWGGDDPVWNGFKNKTGNCYVHALCLRALLTEKGYTTKLIWTTEKTHYWLLIYLNGTWRHIDPTPSSLHGRYSLMTDEQRLSTLSGRVWDFEAWPACE